MLSRLLQKVQVNRVMTTQARFYRPGTINTYKVDPTPISHAERIVQDDLPVWDRIFDHAKYMKHDGPLKLSTGIAYLDVEPFPRMKLMKLYYLNLQELRDLPDSYGYKFLSQELTRYRMKVVDDNTSIRAIEDKIASGLVEELIHDAHNEIKLMRIMKQWKPWETINTRDYEGKEELQGFMSFKTGNPFPVAFERYDNMKHEAEPRKATAAVHPEDKE